MCASSLSSIENSSRNLVTSGREGVHFLCNHLWSDGDRDYYFDGFPDPNIPFNTKGPEDMIEIPVLYPNESPWKMLEIAPEGFGYLFEVTRPDNRTISFVLNDWHASEITVHYLEREGYRVEVRPLAYEPDEDFLNNLLAETVPNSAQPAPQFPPES